MWNLTKLEQEADRPGGSGSPPAGTGSARAGNTAIIAAVSLAAAELALRAVAGRGVGLEGTRATQSQREAGRLAAKHGAKSAPAVKSAARAKARGVEARGAAIVAARAKVPIVTAVPDAAVVHGRVVDRERRARAGVEVEVRVDERTVVKATSDRDGYYRVDVPVAAAAAARIPIVGARPAAARMIASHGGRAVARDATLTIVGGKVIYRELVVDE